MLHKRHVWLCLIVLGVSGYSPFISQARASTVLAASDVELVKAADLVVLGHIDSVHIEAAPGGGWMTVARVTLKQLIRSAELDVAVGQVISVASLGGSGTDGKTTHVYGAPKLTVGRQALMFLRLSPDGSYRSLGLSYGVWPVIRGDDGQMRATRDVSDLHLVNRQGQTLRTLPASINGETLSQTLERLTTLARGMKR